MVHQNSSRVNRSSTAENGSLGNNGKSASTSFPHPPSKTTDKNDILIDRYFMQSLARELIPHEAIAGCLRWHTFGNDTVEVYKNELTGRAHYSGLQTCGSVWGCPVCSARISEHRRQEMAVALLNPHKTDADGVITPLFVYMVTFTFQHNKRARLSCDASVRGVLGGHRALKSGRFWQDFKNEYGFVGSVRGLEVTIGDHGWHPHIHEAMVFDRELTPAMLHGLAGDLKARWRVVLGKVGLTAAWEYGVDIRETDKDVADYIAKFGHEPKKTDWNITHELTKAMQKKAAFKGRSMFQLLREYGDGDIKAGRLWQEYYKAFKGRKQLIWSRGLAELLGVGAEASDEVLAQETQSDVDVRLSALTPAQWRAVLKADVRAELLVKASTASLDEYKAWLADIFDRYMSAADRAFSADGVRVGVEKNGAYFTW